ncbi:MAG: hypothetical protein AAGI72_07160 [Pseudomonadota bacterium]
MFRFILIATALTTLMSVTKSIAAPILNVDPVTEDLFGATGVEVEGRLFDVEFVDGTCFALFSRCDEAEDFAFSSEASALAAAQALLDTVLIENLNTPSLLDNFDRFPSQTNGIGSIPLGNLLIPYAVNGSMVDLAFAGNTNPDFEGMRGPVPGGIIGPDFLGVTTLSIGHDTGRDANQSFQAFAVFTPSAVATVPVPGSAPSLILGLLGLSAVRRLRRVRKTSSGKA